MAIFYLIRHGQNDLIGDKLAGRMPGVHLNQAGRDQAARLAQALAHQPLQAVYASPLERTRETAAPIAQTHQLKVQTSKDLLEIDFGDWEGKSLDLLKHEELWEQIQAHPSTVRFPNGESYQEAQARVVGEIIRLNKAHHRDDHIVCVSHSDVIRLMIAYFLGMPLDTFQRLRIAPASLSVLHLSDGRASLQSVNQNIQI